MDSLPIILRIVFVTFLLITIPFTASASDPNKWTWEDTALQTIYSGLLISDWSQTLHISRNPVHYYEKKSDQFIGKYPSKRDVNVHFTTMLLGHAAVSYLLPKPYRTIWQSVYIIYEYDIIQDNRNIGLGINIHY